MKETKLNYTIVDNAGNAHKLQGSSDTEILATLKTRFVDYIASVLSGDSIVVYRPNGYILAYINTATGEQTVKSMSYWVGEDQSDDEPTKETNDEAQSDDEPTEETNDEAQSDNEPMYERNIEFVVSFFFDSGREYQVYCKTDDLLFMFSPSVISPYVNIKNSFYINVFNLIEPGEKIKGINVRRYYPDFDLPF